MKKLIFIILTLLFSADTKAEDFLEGICDSATDYGSRAMSARQNGISQKNASELLGTIKHKNGERMDEIAKDILLKAYSVPIYKTLAEKQNEVKRFTGKVSEYCSSIANNTNQEISELKAKVESSQVTEYKVQRGDTLASIAKKHNVDWQKIAEWNSLTPESSIYVGQTLKILPSLSKKIIEEKANTKENITLPRKEDEPKLKKPIASSNSDIDDDQYCKTESWFSLQAMTLRQKGAPKTKALELNHEMYIGLKQRGYDDKQGYAERITQANRAYTLPIKKTEQAKKQAILDFANEYYYKCLGNL